MTSVALVMIVKDEASVITRALDSAKPFVDSVLIEDTGSTDGTQQIITDWLNRANIPGFVIEEPWQNFAFNRSHLLAEARKRLDVDYLLMLDADETVTIKDSAILKQQLTADAYHIEMQLGQIVYALPRIIRNRLPFYYRGPVHEFLDCKEPFSHGEPLSGISIREVGGGAREKDPATYKRDAELFEEALSHPDLDVLERSRYTFYLAQSLRDAGEVEASLLAYWRRVALGGWPEEVYISLLNAARLQQQLKHPLAEIYKTYKQAIEANPNRAEAYHGAARFLRLADLFHESYGIAKKGLSIKVKLPLHSGLFVEQWIYKYGLLDEFAISAYYAGEYTESWLANMLVLTRDIDDATRQRILKNAAFVAAKR